MHISLSQCEGLFLFVFIALLFGFCIFATNIN
nr:MAG TPA: hypothetical protein [Caudoviricetes sp.]DAQ55442.1 MAG TPA: hypothetical protein [Caudoviricetes sp.]